MTPHIVVSDARGAAAADAAAIAAGIPSRALMQRAGVAAAQEISRRFPHELRRGVLVACGSGNNGGDGWVVARALHAVGVRVRVVELLDANTDDARAERALAMQDGVRVENGVDMLPVGSESIVVDALLGTGFTAGSDLRGPIAHGVAHLRTLAERGASVVALDLPSGLDATTGESRGDLRASLTVTFGTVKAGLLRARDKAGIIVCVDIGLGHFAREAGGGTLATFPWFLNALPSIAANAHKGTRKKVAIIGGAHGMAGAVLLAARAALRSGAGLVKCVVEEDSLLAMQKGEPSALAARWPASADEWRSTVSEWADAVLIGPGLGRGHRDLVEALLHNFTGPAILDADALNAYENDAASMGSLIGDRQALITPHPLEFSRLGGIRGIASTIEDQQRVVRDTRATLLLKGVPTEITDPSGERVFVAEGTPVLATGGAGDALGGIAVTLLAQTGSATTAGALAAFAHGRAAASVSAGQVRGHTIEDVIEALPAVWSLEPSHPTVPILVELPAVAST